AHPQQRRQHRAGAGRDRLGRRGNLRRPRWLDQAAALRAGAAMSAISGRYAIVGVGESDIGRRLGRSGMALQLEAAQRAPVEPGLEKAASHAVPPRPSHAEPAFNYSAVLAGLMGIAPSYFTDIALSGAAAAAMVLDAVAAIEAGLCTTVLIVSGDAQTARGG